MKVGITGHQKFATQIISDWVNRRLKLAIDSQYISVGYTCLAAGTDQLFAKTLKKKNIPYIAVVPCKNYESAFEAKSEQKKYVDLLKTANEVVTLPYKKPSEKAFYNAGKKMVDMSDLIIAVWNGKPARGHGGTADVVKYAVSKKKKIIHLNPITRKISSI